MSAALQGGTQERVAGSDTATRFGVIEHEL